MATRSSHSRKAAALFVALTLLVTACSQALVRVDREMVLAFNFVLLEPDATGYTVVISDRDAETLGSATESETLVENSRITGHHVQSFTASNFIDEYDFDDIEPDPPCLQDAVMLREPSGNVIELRPAGECLGLSWGVTERDVQPVKN